MKNKHRTSLEANKNNNKVEEKPHSSSSYVRTLIWVSIAVALGYAHVKHVETLFENDKHFSHLSTLERELSFRTESGLYYYYFKSLVVDQDTSQSFFHLINTVFLHDNRTEHPNVINSLQRFNLYPEIVLGAFYRFFDRLGYLKKTCWKVNRGNDMPAVESCEGLQEPIYFYSKSIFVLHGFLVFLLFTLSYKLNNESISSGLIACVCYFYNHSEATRVMWVPALRESFSFPFHLLQILSLVNLVRASSSSSCRGTTYFFVVSSLLYLLPWQFAQFSLATQLVAILVVYSLGFLSRDRFLLIVRLKTLTLAICFALMFANRMLLGSLYASVLFSTWMIIFLEDRLFKSMKSNNTISFFKTLFYSIMRLVILFASMIVFKKIILDFVFKLEDDSHIWDILKSKLDPIYHTFDTRLYTCAKEFDFIELSTVYKLSTTLLLPISLVNVLYLGVLMAKKVLMSETKTNEDALVVYNLLQMIAYGLMAVLIMRLKLFWTPYLCVIASYVANKSKSYEYLRFINFNRQIPSQNRYVILVLLVALMSYQGINNLRDQYKIVGEYSSFDMELMMKWISQNTKPNDAFVGPMSAMANIKLSTNRPIVNHPHYEDVGLRNRTKHIYSLMYGYVSPKQLYKLLKFELQASYVLVEEHYCLSGPPGKPECALNAIAQLFLVNRTSQKRACEQMLEHGELATPYFVQVYKRGILNLFRIVQ